LTARCVVVTKSMPVFEGVLLHFHIFYCSGSLAMTHPFFMSHYPSPFCEPTATHPSY
jgi:hypothetical protein